MTLRVKRPYGIYDRFQFEIPTGTVGDNWERYLMRVLEIGESARIISQARKNLPEGPVMVKIPKVIKPPVGEVYHANESPRGGTGIPYCKRRDNQAVPFACPQTDFL